MAVGVLAIKKLQLQESLTLVHIHQSWEQHPGGLRVQGSLICRTTQLLPEAIFTRSRHATLAFAAARSS